MKKLYYISLIFLFSFLIGCSEDGSNNNVNDGEEVGQNLLIGNWTAVGLGVIYDDESEESADNPCGTFQKVRFLENGVLESDNYLPDNEVCEFSETWSGTYMEINNENFPEANYELIIEQDVGQDFIRYPEITFDGENTLKIQYPWSGPSGGNIAYSFILYERE